MLQIVGVIVELSLLFKGETALTKTRRVRGPAARFIGVLFLVAAALPMFVQLDRTGDADAAFNEIGLMIGLFVVALVIAFAGSEKFDPEAEGDEEEEEPAPRRKKKRKKKRRKASRDD